MRPGSVSCRLAKARKMRSLSRISMHFVPVLQTYDLYIGSVGEQAGGAEDGCPRTDDACAQCPVNSTCDANLLGDSKCTCLPGVRGENCDIGEY